MWREPPAQLGDGEAEHDPERAAPGPLDRDRDAVVVDRADGESASPRCS
jgi:hypothetical protein